MAPSTGCAAAASGCGVPAETASAAFAGHRGSIPPSAGSRRALPACANGLAMVVGLAASSSSHACPPPGTQCTSDRSSRSSPCSLPSPRTRRTRRASSSRSRTRPAGGGGGAPAAHRRAALHALPRRSQGQEDHGDDRRAAVERHRSRRSSRTTGRTSRRSTRGCARSGLRTYTPEEIRKQIAQAEIDAYFRNDPDAALAAAKRLGASFVLRGLISSQAVPNPVMRRQPGLGEHGLHAHRQRTAGSFRTSQASSSSYAGADVARMALTLVNEQADEVVARLYGDYCRNAGTRRGRQGGAEVSRGRFAIAADPWRELRHEPIAPVRALVTAGARRCARSRARARDRAADLRQPVADRGKLDVAEGQRRGRPGDLPAGRVHERRQEGPGADRPSGRDQEQQRDVPAEVHGEQHRGLRRDRAVQRQLPGARALESRPAAQRVHARLQPRRSAGGAQVPGHGQAEDAPSTSSSSTS